MRYRSIYIKSFLYNCTAAILTYQPLPQSHKAARMPQMSTIFCRHLNLNTAEVTSVNTLVLLALGALGTLRGLTLALTLGAGLRSSGGANRDSHKAGLATTEAARATKATTWLGSTRGGRARFTAESASRLGSARGERARATATATGSLEVTGRLGTRHTTAETSGWGSTRGARTRAARLVAAMTTVTAVAARSSNGTGGLGSARGGCTTLTTAEATSGLGIAGGERAALTTTKAAGREGTGGLRASGNLRSRGGILTLAELIYVST